MLALVVCKILFPGEIFDVEFPLCHSISNPEEMHFHRPGTLPFHGVVGNANCGGIIAIYGCGGLRVAHFLSLSQKIVACLQFGKRAPSLASAAEAMTNHKIS
jgi:hypothetical protein